MNDQSRFEVEGIPAIQARCFHVYDGDQLVLTVQDRPGKLRSTAPPPPGPTSPAEDSQAFLKAQAHDPASEHALRQLMSRAKNFDEYLAALLGYGFDIATEQEIRLGAGFRVLDGSVTAGAVWEAGGQFACLWWQPAGEQLTFDHALMTVYEEERAGELFEVLSATETFADLAQRLRERGFRLLRISGGAG